MMTKKTNGKTDATGKARIAPETSREKATVAVLYRTAKAMIEIEVRSTLIQRPQGRMAIISLFGQRAGYSMARR
jgi:hypothetical protein